MLLEARSALARRFATTMELLARDGRVVRPSPVDDDSFEVDGAELELLSTDRVSISIDGYHSWVQVGGRDAYDIARLISATIDGMGQAIADVPTVVTAVVAVGRRSGFRKAVGPAAMDRTVDVNILASDIGVRVHAYTDNGFGAVYATLTCEIIFNGTGWIISINALVDGQDGPEMEWQGARDEMTWQDAVEELGRHLRAAAHRSTS